MRMRKPPVVVAAVVSAALMLVGCSSGKSAVDAGPGSAPAATTGETYAAPYLRGGEFSLLTYNVAGLPQEISRYHPAVNIPLISPLLDPYDVVLTQEDFDWWGKLASQFDFVHYHERLRAKATQKYRSAQHPGPAAVGIDGSTRQMPEVGDGLGVLSKFAIDGNTRVPWTGCYGGFDAEADQGEGDCLAMKGFMLTKLTVTDGVVIDLYNVSFETGETQADQRLREQDLDELAAYVAAHSKGKAVILGGDFAMSMTGDNQDNWNEFLKATGLTDSCAAINCDDADRIDRVAYRSGAGINLEAVRQTVHADEFVDANGEPLSYHDPLEVRFRWTRS